MILFVIYIISGVITSNYLARKKMKFAEMAHAIFFVVFGFFLLFIPFDDVKQVAEIIIGKTSYEVLSKVIYDPYETALVSVSILTTLVATTIALIIIAIGIFAVEYLSLFYMSSPNNKIRGEEKTYRKSFLSIKISNKLFLLNCRLRNW